MKKTALLLALVTVFTSVFAVCTSFADGELVNVFENKNLTRGKVTHTGVLKDKNVSSAFANFTVSDYIEVKAGDKVYFANADQSRLRTLPLLSFIRATNPILSFIRQSRLNIPK